VRPADRPDLQTSEAPNSKDELTEALKLVAEAKDSQKLRRFLETGKMGRFPVLGLFFLSIPLLTFADVVR
jgi:hypothetical protein